MQPQVDFYIIANGSGYKSLHFACQLIDQLYQEQQKIFINTSNQEDAYKLDDLLWTFAEDSFVPHQLGDNNTSVAIGFNLQPQQDYDVLLNFAQQVPTFYTRFKRVIEIVSPDPVVQQLARDRYKYYRDQGIQINTHKS